MVKNKSFLVLLVISFLSLSSAIKTEKTTIDNVIIPQYTTKPAEFILKISDVSKGEYNVYTFADVVLEPKEKFFIENETEINIKMYPLERIPRIKNYIIPVYINDIHKSNYEEKFLVKIIDLRDVFEVYSNLNFPDDKIELYLKNKENTTLKNIKIRFSSIFFDEEKILNIINPFEEKIIQLSVDKEKIKKIPAGSYLVEAKFYTDLGEIIINGKINYGEKKEINTTITKEGFFIVKEKIKKTNTGNTIETIKIEKEKNLFLSLISFFDEKPEGFEIEGMKIKYYWIKRISPGESAEIISKTNYLILLIILFILIGLSLVLRKGYMNNLEIKKTIKPLKTKRGEFAIRVRVHVKANRNVNNVTLIDKFPSLLKVYNKFLPNEPSLIDEKNNRIIWDIGDLQTGEERVFSYILYSKIGIIGKISLPESIVSYEKDNKPYETFSEKVFFLAEQIKR